MKGPSVARWIQAHPRESDGKSENIRDSGDSGGNGDGVGGSDASKVKVSWAEGGLGKEGRMEEGLIYQAAAEEEELYSRVQITRASTKQVV